MSLKVVVHALRTWDTAVDNPLGHEGVPHRMWTWADGSWLLVRFYDDGCARATTSPGISATLEVAGDVIHIQVSPVRRALQRQSTAENELM
ncbi:MAG: hypothetical protein HYV09_18740 [Deltaproteobacteria bacterium]|nr:hypothetical protein [Deltaproteobacteria bacterium]